MSPGGSGQRVPPKAGTLCLPLSASCSHPSEDSPGAGRSKWTSSNHVYIEDRGSRGKHPHSENSPISTSFCFVFNLSKIMCVNQAWRPVPVTPSLRRLRQARPCLRRKKKNDFHKADLSLQICLSFPVPAPGLSWPPGATSPLPLTYFAVFERELSMAGH